MVPAKIRRSHNCVYMGGNLLDLGRWRDGPCRWVRHTVDCLCEKVPDHLTDPVPLLELESELLGEDEDYEYEYEELEGPLR